MPVIVFLTLGLSHLRSEPLSSSDREALLDNLEKLRETAGSRVDARFRVAMTAFSEALASEFSRFSCFGKKSSAHRCLFHQANTSSSR